MPNVTHSRAAGIPPAYGHVGHYVTRTHGRATPRGRVWEAHTQAHNALAGDHVM